MHGAIRAAGYSLMSMFVSCGVGAQDVSVSQKTGFTASPEEARAIAKEAYLYGYPVVEMHKTLYTLASLLPGARNATLAFYEEERGG